MTKIEPLSTEQLMKFLVDISVQLDRKLGLDSGDRDMLSYVFVSIEDLHYILEDDESVVIHNSDIFTAVTNPNLDATIIHNKSYKSS
ncbi:hypothetical protein VPLG_00105 [Vibrio phage eugene 12A10]|uniref:hypothetical protein n=1 Tax=Vibrio phage eugene 12A10 TaxID=573172 RepID=UPI000351DF57|nr:hypothetical protein VPLG_00105 [Vibrio phage eugene 12A10]AGN51544.1 hypothetical protein VPLG_00105 [Vibrio phage eugene 12A10]